MNTPTQTPFKIYDQHLDLVSPVNYLKALRTDGKKTAVFPQGIIKTPDVCYGTTPERPRLLLDIYDSSRERKGNRPAIIFVHGGSWNAGDKNAASHLHAYLALKLDLWVGSIDYRLSHEKPYPAGIQDVRCAIRWLRSVANRYSVDPQRIILMGSSAGAHLAALAALAPPAPFFEGDGGEPSHSSSISHLVLLNGVFDFPLLEKHRHGNIGARIIQFLDATSSSNPARYEEASPTYHVKSSSPPTLILHGDADETVPHSQSQALEDRFQKAGAHVEMEIYPGKGHGWFQSGADLMIVAERIEKFITSQCRITSVLNY